MQEALRVIMEEGLEKRVKRHKNAAKATRNGVNALGLELFAQKDAASNTVTSIKIPEGITDSELRGTMRERYRIELAGGQDHLKGNVFRIGHMGNITHREIISTIAALEMTMQGLGLDVEIGEGVAAVADTYLEGSI
jgi:aspartate aminotransferase-like enzyme